MDNLQKFRSQRKAGIHYLQQEKTSVCKVLVPIKVVPVKNYYFHHPIFEFSA